MSGKRKKEAQRGRQRDWKAARVTVVCWSFACGRAGQQPTVEKQETRKGFWFESVSVPPSTSVPVIAKTFSWNVNWVKMCVFCKQSTYTYVTHTHSITCAYFYMSRSNRKGNGEAKKKKRKRKTQERNGKLLPKWTGNWAACGWGGCFVMVRTTPDSRLIEMLTYWHKTLGGMIGW